VEIRELDAAALADDGVMRDYYDLTRRAELVGREQAPFWTLEELLGTFRSPDTGERQQLFAAYDGERMIACAVLWSFLLDNTDKAWFNLDVDVTDRRRGVGRAMLERIEQVAKADGRTVVMADSKLPFAERETHGYRRFAEACGYQLSNDEVLRHLVLPVPD
jgi:GNAT superfamily N-acetyltransferase